MMSVSRPDFFLLVDVGNSYLKWACLVDGELSAFGSAAHDGESLPVDAIKVWSVEAPARVVVSNVAGQMFECAILQWFAAQWELLPDFVSSVSLLDSYDLKTKYVDPSRLGVDRILVLLAAREWAPVCVVDCGTAVTVDVLSQQNIHLGGIVFPGVTLMRDVLLDKASGVRQGMMTMDDALSDVDFLGKDTLSCVAQGACFAVAGGVGRYMDEIRRDLGEYRCIITGGDALVVQSILKDGYHVVPNLVLRGLQIVAYQNQ